MQFRTNISKMTSSFLPFKDIIEFIFTILAFITTAIIFRDMLTDPENFV